MDRKKFGAVFIALMVGTFLSVGSVWAAAPTQLSGYLMGDPAPGKLVPYYKVGTNLATIIGFDSLEEDGFASGAGEDIFVHVVIFDKRSTRIADFPLCLSPFDFGFLVLQQKPASATQTAELFAGGRFHKARIYSVDGDGIPSEGYVTIKAVVEFNSNDGTCGKFKDDQIEESIDDGTSEPLAAWAILQDIGSGFFATEIPVVTAQVTNPGERSLFDSAALGGVASPGNVFPGNEGIGVSYGLIPGPPLDLTAVAPGGLTLLKPFVKSPKDSNSNRVFVRYDVNPFVGSKTDIYIWLARNAFIVPNDPGSGVVRGSATTGVRVDCEDELELSGSIPTPDEVNVISLDATKPSTFTAGGVKLGSLAQCQAVGQYRGVLQFLMPDTGFVWSQISQENEHFRENFLGYNASCNTFIDPDCDGAD